jgi:hypothetical protein
MSKRVALGLAGGLVLLTSGVIQARAQSSARPEAAAMPDWSGVWAPSQPDIFDAKAGSKATRDHPPYTAGYEAKYKASMAKLKSDKDYNPLTQCLPLGLLWMMSLNGRFEFVATPDMSFVFSDTAAGPKATGNQARRIYSDGRKQLVGDDLFPTYTGNEIGRWEGDTLVVSTVGLNDTNFMDRTGALLSGDAKVTERIRMAGPNTMQDTFTIEDKTALTKPWVVTRTWRRMPPGSAIVDDSCGGRRVDPEALTDAGARAKAQGK